MKLVTAATQAVSLEVVEDGKHTAKTLPVGSKVVIEKETEGLRQLKKLGIIKIREATPIEAVKLEKIVCL